MVEDLGSVLRADVGSLAIQRSRIVAFPENSQELFVGHLRRVVVDLYPFRMPGAARADIFVSRIFQRTARVAYGRGVHTFDMAEGVFHSPEAARRECCFC